MSEQIKKHDMSLTEYINAFSFTDEQFQNFIQVAEECQFAEMKEFLVK